MPAYFVRVGALSEIYSASGPAGLPPRQRVLLRTDRGVELGELVSAAVAASNQSRGDAQILRATRPEDELLLRRLARHKREAVEACRMELSRAGSSATLLDVDQLFDGNTLIMHFLGPVDAAAERITRDVAARYESIVRSRHFAKQLSEGCGPDCGSGESSCDSGCQGCTAASVCRVATAD